MKQNRQNETKLKVSNLIYETGNIANCESVKVTICPRKIKKILGNQKYI